MMNFPLTVTSKGQSAKRTVHIVDAAGGTVLCSIVNITNAQRKPTQIFADEKRKQLSYVLNPTRDKQSITFNAVSPEGGEVGKVYLGGGFTSLDLHVMDAAGKMIAQISSEGKGREMAGAAIGGLVGAAVAGGGAQYFMELPGGGSITLNRNKARSASIEKSGEVSAEHEKLVAICLIVWGAFALT
jgi:orotate phosphoribosyltransferase